MHLLGIRQFKHRQSDREDMKIISNLILLSNSVRVNRSSSLSLRVNTTDMSSL